MHKSQNNSNKTDLKHADPAGDKTNAPSKSVPLPSLVPSALNARKHSAQANIVYRSPLVNQSLLSESRRNKKRLKSSSTHSESNNTFKFDAFAPHSKEEYEHAIAQARLNAMSKHEQIEKSEHQLHVAQQEREQNSALLENAKALAEIALKEGLNNFLFTKDTAENSSKKEPFPYIRTSVSSQHVATDRFLINESKDSIHDAFKLDKGPSIAVGEKRSAYDAAFVDDNSKLPDPSKMGHGVEGSAKDDSSFEMPSRSWLERDINESDVRHEDPQYWAQGGIEAHEESTLPARAFASDGPLDSTDLVYGDADSGTVTALSVPNEQGNVNEACKDQEQLQTLIYQGNGNIIAAHDYTVDTLGHRRQEHSMAHYRGGYMPCYFMYDNGEDRFLLDEGSCRLIGITYTGDWVPSSFVNQQLAFIDEEQIFSVFFNPSEGDKIFSHIKIMQGPNQGERLYISGSVIQRDDTGIAMLVSGYFTQVKSNFMECLCKFMSHSSSFDIDIYTGEVHFGSAFKVMLGLEANYCMPKTIKEYEKQFVHPEDLMVYRKQSDIIYNPQLGDYYESIYRLKHSGGYYIWCIDRGLVIERKRSGKASRIIGTTTNIDVVRSNFERLKRSIYQDPLTGLHNRLYLNTRYKYFTMEESQPLSLVYVDISGLKVINDYLGHAKGDELVKLAAQILTNDVYLDHEVVRLSGDEFLLIFTNCSDVQCKIFINKFACTLDERNRAHEFPLPVYFGFGIATLNEIDDGDTFLRCEARADVRLQEYKTIHRQRIYTALQAFIEAAIGHTVVFNDNRRLEYLDNEPDVVPSDQLSNEERQKRGLAPLRPKSSDSGEVHGANARSDNPAPDDVVPVIAPGYSVKHGRESALLAFSRMQYANFRNAEASAQVFIDAEAELTSVAGHSGVQLRATLNEPQDNLISVQVADGSSAWESKEVAPFNKGNFPDTLLTSNTINVSWQESAPVQEHNQLTPEQERQLILKAEQAALDDMRYAQNSITIPMDLTAGFVAIENTDPGADVQVLDLAHKEAQEARRLNAAASDINNLSDPTELTEQEAQNALSEAQAFLDKLTELQD